MIQQELVYSVCSNQPSEPDFGGIEAQTLLFKNDWFFQTALQNEFDNEPSAGSSKETMLRLLLPLNA